MAMDLLRGWWSPSRPAAASQGATAKVVQPAGPSSQGGAEDGPLASGASDGTSSSNNNSAIGAPLERWSDGRTHITVQEHGGQLLQVAGTAHVPLPSDQVFALITHPANERIFRHLDKCDSRAVLQEGGPSGVTIVESEHLATWRLLMLSGTLRTRLRVEQRPEEGRVHFSLLPSPASWLQPMARFRGVWRVAPAPPAAGAQRGAHQRAGLSTLTLEQEAQPAFYLPPPLGGLFRRIACNQLRGIFEDIQAEAQRIHAGEPTLWPPTPAAGEAAGQCVASGR